MRSGHTAGCSPLCSTPTCTASASSSAPARCRRSTWSATGTGTASCPRVLSTSRRTTARLRRTIIERVRTLPGVPRPRAPGDLYRKPLRPAPRTALACHQQDVRCRAGRQAPSPQRLTHPWCSGVTSRARSSITRVSRRRRVRCAVSSALGCPPGASASNGIAHSCGRAPRAEPRGKSVGPDLGGIGLVGLACQPVEVGGEDLGVDGRKLGQVAVSSVRQPDKELAEVEAGRQQRAEPPVDRHHRAGLAGREKQVRRARVAVRVRLRQLVEPAEQPGQVLAEREHVAGQVRVAGQRQCLRHRGMTPHLAVPQRGQDAGQDPAADVEPQRRVMRAADVREQFVDGRARPAPRRQGAEAAARRAGSRQASSRLGAARCTPTTGRDDPRPGSSRGTGPGCACRRAAPSRCPTGGCRFRSARGSSW